MPRQIGTTEGTISGVAARATGKSATRSDPTAAGETLGEGGGKAEIRGRAAREHRILLSSAALTRPADLSCLRTRRTAALCKSRWIFLP